MIYRFSDIMRENMEYGCALGLYSYTYVKEADESFGDDQSITSVYHPNFAPVCSYTALFCRNDSKRASGTPTRYKMV